MVTARLRTFALAAVLTLAVSVGALVASSAPAQASTPSVSPVVAAQTTTSPANVLAPMSPPLVDSGGGSSGGSDPTSSDLNYLPVLRWAGATGKFHSRLNSSLFNSDLFERLQRDVVAALLMTVGDTLWSATAGFTTQAIRLDVFSVIGSGIDRAAGSLGTALIGSRGTASLVLLLMVASLIAAIIAGRRRGMSGAWKGIGAKMAVVALMAFMVAGATQSTGSGSSYRPGTGSPGWLLTKTEQVVSTVASAPAAALSIPTSELTAKGNPNPYSCDAYTNHLRDSYFTSSGGTRLTNASFVTPVVMSSLWEQTGLKAWKAAQFGMHEDNLYADRVYCRLLESFSGIPTKQQAAMQNSILRKAGETNDADRTSIAFRPITNQDRDMSLVAWAACDGPNENRNAEALTNPHEKNGPTCDEWWTTPAGSGGFDTNHAKFDWEADPGYIDSEVAGIGAQDFLHTLHGDSATIAGPAGPASLAYLFSAIAVFVVFGGVSLLVILAKVGLLFMALASMVVLVVSLIPGVDVGQKVGQFGKQALGLTFISAGAVLVFAFLAFMTQVVQGLGGAMFASNYIMQMLWVAVAPIAAAVIINWIFKSLLKLPSPFKPSSVMAYGAAAGGLGAAAGGMIGGRMGAMARGAQRAASRKLMGAAGSAVKSRMPAALRKGSMAADAASGVAAKDRAREEGSLTPKGEKVLAGVAGAGGAMGLSGAARRRTELQAEKAGSTSKHAAESGKLATALAERREAAEVAKQLRDEQHPDGFAAQLRSRRTADADGNRQSLHRAILGSARTAMASNIGDRVATLKAHPIRSTQRTLAAAGRGSIGLAKTGAKAGVAAVGIAALGPMALPAIGAYAAVKTAPRLAAALPGGSRDRSLIEEARVQYEAERARQKERPPADGQVGPGSTGSPEQLDPAAGHHAPTTATPVVPDRSPTAPSGPLVAEREHPAEAPPRAPQPERPGSVLPAAPEGTISDAPASTSSAPSRRPPAPDHTPSTTPPRTEHPRATELPPQSPAAPRKNEASPRPRLSPNTPAPGQNPVSRPDATPRRQPPTVPPRVPAWTPTAPSSPSAGALSDAAHTPGEEEETK